MNYNRIRRKTKEIAVGPCRIGGQAPIAIQSMTNTDTADAPATVAQIRELERRGCDIVRVSVPSLGAADTILAIRQAGVRIPVVADIHFDYRIALRCAELGFDKIRINPGNIGDDDRVRAVCDACRARNIPIRIGEQRLVGKAHSRAARRAHARGTVRERSLSHLPFGKV